MTERFNDAYYDTLFNDIKMKFKDEYQIYVDVTLNKLVYLALNGTSELIAQLLVYVWLDELRIVDYKSQTSVTEEHRFYHFNHNYWTYCSGDTFVCNNSHEYFKDIIKYYSRLPETKHNNNVIIQADSIIKQLKYSRFTTSISNEIHALMCDIDPDFITKLDNNLNIIRFDNGVYNLQTNKFRDLCVDDYMNISTHSFYDTHTSLHTLDKLLRTMIPDDEMRTFTLTYFATCLTGSIIPYTLILCNNNISGEILLYILKTALGDYCEYISPRVMFNPNAPLSTKTDFNKTRLMTYNLIDEHVNNTCYKTLISDEKMTAKPRYENMITFDKTWKMCISCPTIPKLDYKDDSIWNRTRCIQLSGVDWKLYDNMDFSKEMLLVLVNHYKIYCKQGLKETKSVLKFTKKCRLHYDYTTKFMKENTIESKTKSVSVRKLYDKYVVWMKNIKSLSYKKFIDELRQSYDVIKEGGQYKITGLKFV